MIAQFRRAGFELGDAQREAVFGIERGGPGRGVVVVVSLGIVVGDDGVGLRCGGDSAREDERPVADFGVQILEFAFGLHLEVALRAAEHRMRREPQGIGQREEGTGSVLAPFFTIGLISGTHEGSPALLCVRTLLIVRQAEAVPEFMRRAADEKRIVAAHGDPAVLLVLDHRGLIDK